MLPPSLKRLAPRGVIRAYERELRKETHINRALRGFGGETTYVEIGVRDGECIRQIHASRRLAIDPAPVGPDRIRAAGVELFETTSDAFFQEVAAAELGDARVHVALADGLHEFGQTLRDVLHLEKHMHPGGVIFIHDCNPPSRAHAENRNGPWNGDVWKVAYYLKQFRPDLTYFTLDCDWGLGVVSGFTGTGPTPDQRNVALVAALDYDVLDSDRRRILKLRSPLSALPWVKMRRSFTGS